MWIWLTLMAMMILLAIVLWLIGHNEASPSETTRRFNEVLETPQDASWLNQRKWRQARSFSQKFRRAMERLPGSDMNEVDVLMRQSAIVEDRHRARVLASLWLTPILFALTGGLSAVSYHSPPVLGAFMGLSLGYILPRKLLRVIAARRQKAIQEELPIVLNLMRLLFDAGLSIEHTLKAISEQARKITPELSSEFAWVLVRIQNGQDRGEALEEMANRLDVAELTETVAIVKQAARYGGSLRDSLMRYLKLMEDRRMTSLRDKVGKLSGQMSLVMMLFMFPALLILLAGPAALTLMQALSR
jgi:tight adherence protein C